MQSTFSKGVIFALCAAALNATIGVLSKVLMNNGFTASSVAVIKTVLGCVLLSILLFFLKRPATSTKWAQAAIWHSLASLCCSISKRPPIDTTLRQVW